MILLLLCCAVIPLASFRLVRHWRSLPLPPGPRGLPILGNALQLPATYTWLTFNNLAKIYGDVIHVSVLSSIYDLLVKKGAIYSDRPIVPMAGELGGAAKYFAMAPYGSYSNQEGRKLMLGCMNARNAPSLHRILEEKIGRFTILMSEDAQDVCRHALTAGITRLLAWFRRLWMISRRWLLQMHGWSTAYPYRCTYREWFPGAGFKTMARKACERAEVLKDNKRKLQIKMEDSPYYLVFHVIIRWWQHSEISDTVFRHHPDIQRKAQTEIDSVVGNARPPTFSDRKHLPCLDTVLEEINRINPVGPPGLPHKVRQEDYYKSHRIPAGATIPTNVWAILHDPAIYPDPGRVDPERYLQLREDSVNPGPRLFAFGFGRRACTGQMLAEDTLFITAANVLTQYDFSDAVSLDGSEIRYDGNGIIRTMVVTKQLLSESALTQDIQHSHPYFLIAGKEQIDIWRVDEASNTLRKHVQLSQFVPYGSLMTPIKWPLCLTSGTG
ncbi:cytochrome P450 [Fomitopsis betulina]|nr:cytochrome P450 [Fomitopsis betulina]